MIDKTLSKLVSESLDFVVPNQDEIEALLSDKDLYREYGMALAWMQDYLLRYSSIMIHSRLEPQDSKRYIQEIIANELVLLLVDNLVKNQALVLRLAETAKANAKDIQPLIDDFLNNMAEWLAHLRQATRTGDKSIITNFLNNKAQTSKVSFKYAGTEFEFIATKDEQQSTELILSPDEG